MIITEGKTSALIGDETFWINESGIHLEDIDKEGFVEVSLEGIPDGIGNSHDNLTE